MPKFQLSIATPTAIGINAPPTIDVTNTPEASGVSSPNPSNDKVNIVGNMIELKKPTSKMLNMAIKPLVLTDSNTSTMAPKAKTRNT